MSFGPATFGLRQAIAALLQGQEPSRIAPVPLAPTGGIGPLDLETTAALAALQPQPVPPALSGPVDADAIRARFAGLAGPEPVAPPEQPNPLILRIARALQGFGAGVQGQGPQFLAQLREERERPQREFRARKERFEVRGQELGVMAEQAVLSAEDRRTARTLDLLDRQAERDFQKAVKQSGVKDQRAVEQMRHAFDLERDAKKAEFERLEQERKDAQARKVQIANLANMLTDDFKISRQQARRFAEHELNDVPLSAADAKQYSRIEKYRRPTGGAGAGQPKVMVEIANPDGSTSVVPLTAQVSSGLTAGTITQGPRGIFMEGQQLRSGNVFTEGQQVQLGPPGPAAPTFPEFSGGLMQAPALPAAAAPAGQVFTRAQVEAHARKTKRDPKAIEADLRARGFQVQ